MLKVSQWDRKDPDMVDKQSGLKRKGYGGDGPDKQDGGRNHRGDHVGDRLRLRGGGCSDAGRDPENLASENSFGGDETRDKAPPVWGADKTALQIIATYTGGPGRDKENIHRDFSFQTQNALLISG